MRKRVRVVAALFERKGEFLIARRGGEGPFAGKWEFPGGKVREGEGDEEALQREIREELGVEIRVGSLECETEHDYTELSVHLLFYRCEVVSGVIGRSPDHVELAWVTPGEMGRYDFLEADRPVLRFLARRASSL